MYKAGLAMLVVQYLLGTAVVQVVKDQLQGNVDSNFAMDEEAFVDNFGDLEMLLE